MILGRLDCSGAARANAALTALPRLLRVSRLPLT